MTTFEDFNKEIKAMANSRPDFIRYGQAVFNYIDNNYGVARIVQKDMDIDCFYDDTLVDQFIEACYNVLNNK